MKIKTVYQVGGVDYEMFFEEKDDRDTLHKAIVLSNPPKVCNECQNREYFRMDSNKDKEGNIYINVVCRKCGAKAKLGLYKTGGYFWHKFDLYVPKTESTIRTSQPEDKPSQEVSPDEFAF